MPTPPYNNTINDPFLCSDCQQLGYCRKSREGIIQDLLPKHYEILSKSNPEHHYFKDIDISNLVPVKTMVKDFMTTAGKKLQEAHDLFHQNEYEQASYLYRDLLTQRADFYEAAIGLSACYYFMKQYEEAASVASGVNHFAFGKVLPQFLDACANAALKLATIEIKQDKKENVQFVDDGER
jgi:hypothetical protein